MEQRTVACDELWPGGISNKKFRMMKCGIAALSLFKIDRIHYFDIRHSLFDIRYSLFQSFFFRFDAARMKLHKIQDHLGKSYWLVGVASGHDYPGTLNP
jgi:hypothetical protein